MRSDVEVEGGCVCVRRNVCRRVCVSGVSESIQGHDVSNGCG